jgi:hypothetical protein
LTGLSIDDATFRKDMERVAHFVTQQMRQMATARK